MIDTSELKHLTECDRDMLKSALAWKSIANAAHNEGLCIGKGMAPNERDESGVSANQYMNAYSRMEDESDKAVLVIANELNGLRADNERLTQENAALRELVERQQLGLDEAHKLMPYLHQYVSDGTELDGMVQLWLDNYEAMKRGAK